MNDSNNDIGFGGDKSTGRLLFWMLVVATKVEGAENPVADNNNMHVHISKTWCPLIYFIFYYQMISIPLV